MIQIGEWDSNRIKSRNQKEHKREVINKKAYKNQAVEEEEGIIIVKYNGRKIRNKISSMIVTG
jgi:ACT domain-containing protein